MQISFFNEKQPTIRSFERTITSESGGNEIMKRVSKQISNQRHRHKQHINFTICAHLNAIKLATRTIQQVIRSTF